MYFSVPVKEIRWKCQVIQTGYTDEDGIELMKLVLLHEFRLSDKLSYKALKRHGIKSSLMSAEKIKDVHLLEYIDSIEREDASPESRDMYLQSLSDDDLKAIARRHSNERKTHTLTGTAYQRDPYIAQYAKVRAAGICQLCRQQAPFLDRYGKPYLESHHIEWLSRGGEDSIDNTVALCPNCHRKMHVLSEESDIQFLKRAKQ